MSLTAARSELTGIHNALQGRTQEERRRLFKSDRFMLVWMDGVNALIKRWREIQDMFTGRQR